MVLDLEKYAMREGVTPLSAEELNARFYALVRRIHELETLRMDWLAAVAQVQNHGLARINDAVAPLLEGLRRDMEGVIALGEAAQAEQAQAAADMIVQMEGALTSMRAAQVGWRTELDQWLAELETRVDSAVEAIPAPSLTAAPGKVPVAGDDGKLDETWVAPSVGSALYLFNRYQSFGF